MSQRPHDLVVGPLCRESTNDGTEDSQTTGRSRTEGRADATHESRSDDDSLPRTHIPRAQQSRQDIFRR
jgi:hypothetical protein